MRQVQLKRVLLHFFRNVVGKYSSVTGHFFFFFFSSVVYHVPLGHFSGDNIMSIQPMPQNTMSD